MTTLLSFLFWYGQYLPSSLANRTKELMERGSLKGLLQHPELSFGVKKNVAIGAASGM